MVEVEPCLLELIRHVRLNPLRAQVVRHLRTLDRFPWTGHSALLGTVPLPWQEAATILRHFDTTPARARRDYRVFVAAGPPQGHRSECGGGGSPIGPSLCSHDLVPSLGLSFRHSMSTTGVHPAPRRRTMRRQARGWMWIAALTAMLAVAWTVPAGAAESTLDQVLKRGKIIVGIGLSQPPFGMYDANKQPSGFDVDLAKLIAQELKVEIEWVDTSAVNRIPYLLTNKVDLVVATFGPTPERAKQVAFTKPYVAWNLVLLGWKSDRSIRSYTDLKGKTVGATRGTTQDIAITRLAPDAKIIRYEDDATSKLAIQQRKVDALATGEVMALHYAKENKELEPKGVISRSWATMAVRRGDPDWLQWLNTFLDWHGGQGKLAELYEKWNGVEMSPALPSW